MLQTDLSVAYRRFAAMGLDFARLLPSIVIGILLLVVFAVIARLAKALVQRLNAKRKKHHNLGIVLGRLAQWGVMLLGVLISVTVAFPSFTPANLISALGITGIAIGFAFKDIFENFLAGVLILVTEPFRIDDQIVFGAFEGTIEHIEARATKLRTYDGRLVVIPNADLFKGSVIVNTAFPTRRLEYDFAIGNGDDIQAAKKIMLDVIRGTDGVVADPPPDALVFGYGDNGVTIRIRWWINPPRKADAIAARDRVLEGVKNALTKAGIDLPYPTHQVLFHDQTEATDGDRSAQREGWPAGAGKVPPARSIAGALLAQQSQQPQQPQQSQQPQQAQQPR